MPCSLLISISLSLSVCSMLCGILCVMLCMLHETCCLLPVRVWHKAQFCCLLFVYSSLAARQSATPRGYTPLLLLLYFELTKNKRVYMLYACPVCLS